LTHFNQLERCGKAPSSPDLFGTRLLRAGPCRHRSARQHRRSAPVHQAQLPRLRDALSRGAKSRSGGRALSWDWRSNLWPILPRIRTKPGASLWVRSHGKDWGGEMRYPSG